MVTTRPAQDDGKAHGPWPGRKHRHEAADLWLFQKGRVLAQDGVTESSKVAAA